MSIVAVGIATKASKQGDLQYCPRQLEKETIFGCGYRLNYKYNSNYKSIKLLFCHP